MNKNEPISLPDTMRRIERMFIIRALDLVDGKVSHAAPLLGLSHQTLLAKINTRHTDLVNYRSPIYPRKTSIETKRRNQQKRRNRKKGGKRR
jgi:hypothetical protein